MQKTILFAAFLLSNLSLWGQSTFHKKFDNSQFLSIVPLENGGALGMGRIFGINSPNSMLVQFDDLGEIIWKKEFPTMDFIRYAAQTTDGFLVVGDSTKPTGPFPRPQHGIVAKLDNQGTVVWAKILGSADEITSIDHVLKVPGGYVISGRSKPVNLPTISESVVSKLDESGNTVWSKSYFYNLPSYNLELSAHLIEGDTLYAYGHLQGNGSFVQLNAQTGELFGWVSMGGLYFDVFSSIKPTQDGHFILSGSTRSTTGSEEDRPWLVKINRSGQIIWSKTYNIPGTNCAAYVEETDDGNLVFSFGQALQSGSINQVILVKIDTSGDIIWAYNYASGLVYDLGEVHRTHDGGILVAAEHGMLKTDSDGRINNGCCPAPIDILVEDYVPNQQNIALEEENWEQATPFFMQSDSNPFLIVEDACTIPITSFTEQVFVCQGDSILLNGAYYQAPYTLIDTVQNLEGGCDTVFVYNLVQIPQPFRVETISFCPGNSVTIQGVNYTAPDTIYQILPATAGCDTLLVTFLKSKPLPVKYETTTFCPGDTVFLDGVAYLYPVVLPNPDTLPGLADACDTLLYQQLAYPDEPSSVSISCPPDLVVNTAPATPLVVNYTMPAATSDCSCPEPSFFLQEGLPSGALFPVGPTQICYSAYDICGDYKTCCFKVTVQEEDPCDVKETACVRYELLAISNDGNQDNTYRWRVTNRCASPLEYTAIQIPNTVDALAPDHNSVYTTLNGREYLVRNPNMSPFRSVRFKALGASIADGQSDVFEYTLPAQSNPLFIKVTTKLSSGVSYESLLNTFGCAVLDNRGVDRAVPQSDEVSGLKVFPNPNSGVLIVDVSETGNCGGQLRLLNAQGLELLQRVLPAHEAEALFPLPENLVNGVYFIELKSECSTTEMVRFVLNR